MDYYTYAYLREDRTPYYIGKGKENRIYSKNRTIHPPKDKSRIIFLKQNLTEEEAFKHERYMIGVFGRKDLGTGILHNMTDGGEGCSNPSPESRRKNAERNKKAYVNGTNPLSKLTEEERKKYQAMAVQSRMNSQWLKDNPEYNGGSLGRTPEQHIVDSARAIENGCAKYWKSIPEEERYTLRAENGRKGGQKNKELGIGICGLSFDERSKMSKKKFENSDLVQQYKEQGKKLYLEGKGIADPKAREKCRLINLERTSKEFCVMSPEGKVYKGKGRKPFAREHGLPTTCFNNLVRGRIKCYKGWIVPQVEHP
jgi:hypothetical protein